MTAMLQAYLVGNRTLVEAIAREARPHAGSRRAALELMQVLAGRLAMITSAMVDAYVETERGELADVEAERRDLLEVLLDSGAAARPELVRRAAGLGLEAGRSQVVAIAVAVAANGSDPPSGHRRAVAEAIARGTGAGPAAPVPWRPSLPRIKM